MSNQVFIDPNGSATMLPESKKKKKIQKPRPLKPSTSASGASVRPSLTSGLFGMNGEPELGSVIVPEQVSANELESLNNQPIATTASSCTPRTTHPPTTGRDVQYALSSPQPPYMTQGYRDSLHTTDAPSTAALSHLSPTPLSGTHPQIVNDVVELPSSSLPNCSSTHFSSAESIEQEGMSQPSGSYLTYTPRSQAPNARMLGENEPSNSSSMYFIAGSFPSQSVSGSIPSPHPHSQGANPWCPSGMSGVYSDNIHTGIPLNEYS
jgi:hypothetical protein